MNMSAMKNPLMAVLWGAVLVGAATSAYVIVAVDDGTGALSTFTSRSQLDSYIDEMHGGSYWNERAPSAPDEAADADYTSTNVQVQGVDEGDNVKTDGEYIYLATSQNVTIVDAVPADQMEVVTTIEADSIVTAEEGVEMSVRICGLLLHEDRLVIIAVVHSWVEYADEDIAYAWIIDNFPRTVAAVYDVSDASDPAMVGLVGLSGGYLTSRAVDGIAYLVTNHFIYTYDERNFLPVVSTEAGGEEVDATDILYDPTASDVGSFTNILALDTETMGFGMLSVLTGYTSTIYMSAENLYLTYQKWTGDVVVEDGDLEPEESISATTAIHKVETDGLSMRVTASGTVTGWLLNQFSMDERDGYLRVA
ncbi:MAG: beta-propeller domain-containing protein, partial [Thermoplasmata archaeon]|nr:beta-propeller domain-containing protein [Thermoplasmata archaeon]